MNFLKMQKKVAAIVAAAMITTTLVPMGAIAMAENQTEKKAVKIVQTAGRDQLGEFAPEFARYNDDILFGEVWSRNDKLSLRDRSIVTVCSLIGSISRTLSSPTMARRRQASGSLPPSLSDMASPLWSDRQAQYNSAHARD